MSDEIEDTKAAEETTVDEKVSLHTASLGGNVTIDLASYARLTLACTSLSRHC